MTRTQWKSLIDTIPPGLTYQESASFIGKSYHQTYYWMREFRIRPPQRAGVGQLRFKSRMTWGPVDWTLRDVDIARKMGKTRERVRQVRQILKMPKVGKVGRRSKIELDNVK